MTKLQNRNINFHTKPNRERQNARALAFHVCMADKRLLLCPCVYDIFIAYRSKVSKLPARSGFRVNYLIGVRGERRSKAPESHVTLETSPPTLEITKRKFMEDNTRVASLSLTFNVQIHGRNEKRRNGAKVREKV